MGAHTCTAHRNVHATSGSKETLIFQIHEENCLETWLNYQGDIKNAPKKLGAIFACMQAQCALMCMHVSIFGNRFLTVHNSPRHYPCDDQIL